MIKNKEDLKRTIDELKVLIKETEETINEAYKASESMVEPTKSFFIQELRLKTIQLNNNKVMLEHFKLMTGD